MKRDFKLPLVGLGTCYYEFSKENPDAGVRLRCGGLRSLLEPELAEKTGRIAPKFFANLIRFHNHFTGETLTTDLSPRSWAFQAVA